MQTSKIDECLFLMEFKYGDKIHKRKFLELIIIFMN